MAIRGNVFVGNNVVSRDPNIRVLECGCEVLLGEVATMHRPCQRHSLTALRNKFAGLALNALVVHGVDGKGTAAKAVELADDLIAELEKGK